MSGPFDDLVEALWGYLPSSYFEAWRNASRVMELLFEFAVRSVHDGKESTTLMQILAMRRRIASAMDLLLAEAERIQ